MTNKEADYLTHCKECSKCPSSSCCYYEDHTGFIAVSIKDAERIKKETGQPYSEFLDFSLLPEEIIEECRTDPSGSEGEMRYKMLKNNRLLRLKRKKNHCVFLDEQYRCTIYYFKPLICSMYPFWYEIKQGEVKIVPHDRDMDCAFIKNRIHVPSATTDKLKQIALQIEDEREDYLKRINAFVRKNKL